MKRYVVYLNIKEVDVTDEDDYIHGIDGLFVLSSHATHEQAEEDVVNVVADYDAQCARRFLEKSH